MSLALRRGLLAFVAILIAEAVWILAVPPFRGSDEVDHVFRAAGAATGQLYLGNGAPHGRGHVVWVPSDLVAAAQPQCTSLSYVGHDNCYAIRTSGDRSLVASAAGDYDPLFYVIVGTAARPFHGTAADYAMRVTNAVLCALVLALGVGVLSLAGTGRWVSLGVLATLTPEVLFSAAIPGPNGLEMSLGFVLWASLLAAVRRDDDPHLQRRLLVLAGAVAVPLTFLRFFGPVWVLLILGSVGLTIGLHRVRDLIRGHRGVVVGGSVAVFAGACWCATWLLLNARATGVQPDVDTQKWILAFNLPAFVLQMIGAFPYRDIAAPLGIYPLALFVIGLMVGAAWRRGATLRTRRAVFWIAIASLVVPVVLSLLLMPSKGAVWQGRYELPYVIGILPLCGLLLDEADFAPVEGPRLVALSGILVVIAQVACPFHVEQLELKRAVSVADAAWWHPPGVVLAALMLMACAVAGQLTRRNPPAAVLSGDITAEREATRTSRLP
jgi:hypothetical protein